MSRETSPEWPDPSTWAKALVAELQLRVAAYEAEPDFELKRNKAGNYIGAIAGFLQELPPFKGKDLLVPIKDLIIWIKALEDGSGHPWTKARNFGGTNAETAAETEVRVWVVMGVWSLLEGGYRRNQAYKRLANSLTKSGRTRKGKPFPHRTVQRWWLAYEHKRDSRLEVVDRHIRRYWAEMECPHGRGMFDCPSTAEGRCAAWREVSEEFADRALSVPVFRDWFISLSKNEPSA